MIGRHLRAAIGIGCLAAVTASPAYAQQSPVVARASFGGRDLSVTANDVRLEVFLIRRNGTGTPLTFTSASLEAIVQSVLRRKLLATEAQRRRLDVEPSVATQVVRATDAVLAEAEVSREAATVDTGDTAVQRFYQSHADDFRSAPRRKVRHIVVATEAEAKAARAAIAAGATFEAVARERNTDTTKATGGDLGWMAQGSMVKAFDETVFATGRGTISAPVQTAMGWHLVLVEDLDPGSLPPLALTRDRVVEAMRQEAVQRLTTRLFDESKVSIDRAALEELLK